MCLAGLSRVTQVMLSSLPVAACLQPTCGVRGSGEGSVQHHRDTGLVHNHSCLCSMLGFSPAVRGSALCCQTQSNCLVGLNYWVRGRCPWSPEALRLDTQPCLPHGNSVLGLSLCPWHFCSCGDHQPGERLYGSVKHKFWKPHGLAVGLGSLGSVCGGSRLCWK